MNDEKVAEVYTQLESLTHVGKAEKQAHVERINKNIEKSKEQKNRGDKIIEDVEQPLLCPRCGGRLVLRVAKKGSNIGNHFYGCSNYPKCRYIKG